MSDTPTPIDPVPATAVPPDDAGIESAPPVYAGDVDVSPNPVSIVEPPHEKGRLLLHTGCVTLALALVIATVSGLAAGLVGARFILTGSLWGDAPVSAPAVVATSSGEPVVAAAAAALPSVVNIDITGSENASDTSSLPQGHPDVKDAPFTGQASGVAYKAAPGGGTYIITNDHVVAGAKTIMVTPPGGDKVEAVLVGTDPDTDIAVVKVPVKVPAVRLGVSEKLVVGQLLVAIGSPFGLQHSVSSGVVSGLHRSLPGSYGDADPGVYPLVDVIQTDAAINPGNSGGALVDRRGLLVGINSAIYSDSGSSAGIGFAIPVKTVVRIADELISKGVASHPFLGVVGQCVDELLAKEKKLPVGEGAFVVEITKGTMAEKAGIKVDDLIVALDGTPIRSMDDLILQVRRTQVGQKVTITLYRAGKKIDVPMTVGDKPKK
ncbi:MAG: trypsin-like peptidase domain-containing protein [Coriobacteriia bacterium]|nr:trypsin-like peptidase domain-containing protein [Coriobacteriia bacterium]